YDAANVLRAESALAHAGLAPNIVVDSSHANSLKDHNRQPGVFRDCVEQIVGGNRSIVGLMAESNLNGGHQSIPADRSLLQYGVSVTDACVDWETTERMVTSAAEALSGRLSGRGAQPVGSCRIDRLAAHAHLRLRQHLAGIEDVARIERVFQLAHDGDLRLAARIRQVGQAQRADAVLGRRRALPVAHQPIDQLLDTDGVDASRRLHVQVEIRIADVAEERGARLRPGGRDGFANRGYEAPDITCRDADVVPERWPPQPRKLGRRVADLPERGRLTGRQRDGTVDDDAGIDRRGQHLLEVP